MKKDAVSGLQEQAMELKDCQDVAPIQARRSRYTRDALPRENIVLSPLLPAPGARCPRLGEGEPTSPPSLGRTRLGNANHRHGCSPLPRRRAPGSVPFPPPRHPA